MKTLLLPHFLCSYWSNSFIFWITDLGSFWIWCWSFFFWCHEDDFSTLKSLLLDGLELFIWRQRSEDFFGTKFHCVKVENICACFAVSAIKCTQLKLLDHQFRCSCMEQQCLPHSWRARYFKNLLKLINHIRRMHS
jgi:hypothetical protein